MASDDNTAGHGFHQFSKLKPSEEEDGEESSSSSGEGTLSAIGLAIEQRPNDEPIRDDNEELGVKGRLIPPNKPELSLRAGCCSISRGTLTYFF